MRLVARTGFMAVALIALAVAMTEPTWANTVLCDSSAATDPTAGTCTFGPKITTTPGFKDSDALAEYAKTADLDRNNRSFEIDDDDYLTSGALTSSHIWLVSPNGGAARRLTSGAWSLPVAHPPGPAPSGSRCARSVRVQSNTGMKL